MADHGEPAGTAAVAERPRHAEPDRGAERAARPAGSERPAGPPRLADAAVRDRLEDLDAALADLEQSPDGGPALDAVAVLLEVYGEALGRVLDHADPATRKALAADELVGHLLELHDLRPPAVPARPERSPSGSAFIPVEALTRSASRAAS